MVQQKLSPARLPSSTLQNPKLLSFLKQADVLQPKVDEDATRVTARGGWLSLISLFLALLVTIRYLTRPDQHVERIAVDTDISSKMRVHLNLSLHHLACSEVDLVVMELSGEVQIDPAQSVHKMRTRNGMPLVDSADDENAKKSLSVPEKCGSCYGAERFAGDCCRTW